MNVKGTGRPLLQNTTGQVAAFVFVFKADGQQVLVRHLLNSWV